MPFLDRADAGRRPATRVIASCGDEGGDVVVLGLPRGGVPVAFEVAAALGAPLDVILVRKLGVPYQPELAMGAIGEGGVEVVDPALVRTTLVGDEELAAVEAHERAELDRRARRYRGDRPRVPVAGRTAIIVDDGVATGSTARAGCRVARAQGAARVVLAVPAHTLKELRSDIDIDEVICLEAPDWFLAIGQFYADFSQTSDEDVVDLLERAAARSLVGPPARDAEVEVPVGRVSLAGVLTVPSTRWAPSCSCMGAGAAATARATGSSRPCSTPPASPPFSSTC